MDELKCPFCGSTPVSNGTEEDALRARVTELEAALADAQARIDMLYPFNPQNYPANG
jgi:hypothetical protein